jgi:hypothetical protein
MPDEQPGGQVTVRYWAGARAAAGVDTDLLGPCDTVADALAAAVALRPGLAPVAGVSTLLVGGRRAAREDHLEPGALLEVLPPFAGG